MVAVTFLSAFALTCHDTNLLAAIPICIKTSNCFNWLAIDFSQCRNSESGLEPDSALLVSSHYQYNATASPFASSSIVTFLRRTLICFRFISGPFQSPINNSTVLPLTWPLDACNHCTLYPCPLRGNLFIQYALLKLTRSLSIASGWYACAIRTKRIGDNFSTYK